MRINLETIRNVNDLLYEKILEISNLQIINDNDKIIKDIALSIHAKTESIITLLTHGHSAGVDSIIRSIFESSKNLEFILEKDTFIRSQTYLMSIEARKEKNMYNIWKINGRVKADKPTFLHNNFFKKLIQISNPKLEQKNIYPDRWRSIVKRKNADVGIANLKDLCEYLGEKSLKEYNFEYSHFSQEVHGTELKTSDKKTNDIYNQFRIVSLAGYLTDTTFNLIKYYKLKPKN